MKEFSIDQKAKAYDDIIKKANKMLHENCEACQICIEELIPELKESEDERIKKWLIGLIRSNEYGSISDVGYMPCPKHRVLAWIEKQDKKSANIVKSNFKIEKGEWYVGIKTLALEGKLLIIKNSIYYAKEDGAVIGENESLFIDKHDGNASEFLKLWTIQDAKDGDVLMSRAPFIYGRLIPYGGLDWYNGKFIKASNYVFKDSPVHPATKEQKNLLFQKMKEAGYMWDAEKKKIKKIEEKSTWSEEDEELYNDLLDTYFYNDEDYPEDTYKHMLKKVLDWMDERAKYLRPQKQEWSEEDKTKINYLIALLQNCTMNNDSLRVMNEEIEDWLKSLYPSWKPSDEQITQLKRYCPDNRPLTSLYEQLKKLKEE